MSEKRWLWLYLNLPLGAATLVAIGLNFKWPAGGFWINLATTLLGSVIAVNYIDRVLRRHSELQWRGALQLIGKRLQTSCCAAITSIRSAIGLSARQLSLTSPDPAAYLKMCEDKIEPAVDGLVRRLDQAGWKALVKALDLAYRDFQDMLTTFGGKLRPSEFRELMGLQENLRSVILTWQTFPDVLGVEDDKLPVMRRGDEVEAKHELTRRLAAETSAIVTRIRKLGLAAIEFTQNAA